MKVIFVSAYFEIECQLIAKIMNYSLNLDFLFPFFAEYFIKPNIFFNTYSLFYRGYRFHFNQPNWDHQDEVLVPCSSGQLSIVFPIQITTKTTPFSSPSFTGCLSIQNDYISHSQTI